MSLNDCLHGPTQTNSNPHEASPSISFLKQLLEHARGVVQKRPHDHDMLCVLIADLLKPGLIQQDDCGMGISHENGRMGGDDELGVQLHQVMDGGEGGELSRWRQGRLGLIEDKKP